MKVTIVTYVHLFNNFRFSVYREPKILKQLAALALRSAVLLEFFFTFCLTNEHQNYRGGFYKQNMEQQMYLQFFQTQAYYTLSFLGVFEGIRTSSVLVFATNSIGGGYSISSIPVLEQGFEYPPNTPYSMPILRVLLRGVSLEKMCGASGY